MIDIDVIACAIGMVSALFGGYVWGLRRGYELREREE